jgi:hypothetical protein
MTSLRPMVIPAAAIFLAAITPSADARTRGQVNGVWVKTPGPALQTAAAGKVPDRVLPVQAMAPLPFFVGTSPGESAVPGGHHPVAAELTGAAATGRPAIPTARGPPV